MSEVSWELGRKVPLPKTEKSADLTHYFSGVAKFLVKKSNIDLERVTVRPESAFYCGNSPVNMRVQNPGEESFPTFPSGGYAHGWKSLPTK